MIIGAAIFLWVLSVLAVIRLLRVVRESLGSNRVRFGVWTFLILLAVCLLFRPHEDIFGGEDPGSYINSGITYGRQQSFFRVDPLLCQVPAETRSSFYYGNAQYGTTKDACLWVRDPDKAIIGPHFQPAYPLMIGLASRLGGALLALYVIPLFTVLTAIALGALALQCLDHRWAGITAFLFYVLNPLTLWHGRCARPEIIASFMFFGGSALLLYAWKNRTWRQWPDIILGTLCIGFAPFFHITAWLLVIPAALVVLLVIMHGREDFLLAPILALVPMMAFVYQLNHVTDYYALARFLAKPLAQPLLNTTIAVACLLLLAVISLLSRRTRARRNPADNARTVSPVLGALLALVTISFFVVSYTTRDPLGSIPILGRPVQNYLYLTELETFVNMVSIPMALLTLAGWTAWLTGRRRYRQARIVFALAVVPAVMLAGDMGNFMMTRYLLIAIVPVSVLSLTALVTLCPDRGPYAALPAVLALAIGLMGLHHRTHLAKLTEHKGLARFLKPFAEIISKDSGILLCEYSRIAAPFEHFFGIPTLGLDSERRTDYSNAEKAWEDIMKNNPDQQAFFMTPFQPPISDRFDFTLARSATFTDTKLHQARNKLPTRITQGPWPLALYRMTLKTIPGKDRVSLTEPYVVPFGPGNMGLRQFANLRIKTWPIRGVEWRAGERISFDPAPLPNDRAICELFMLLMTESPQPSAPAIVGSGPSRGQFILLVDNWRLFRIRGADLPTKGPLVITTASPAFLVDAIVLTGDRAVSLLKQLPKDRIVNKNMVPIKARWARADSQVLVPVPGSHRGFLMMLLEAPEVRPTGLTDFTVGSDPVYPEITRQISTGKWQWQIWPLRPTDSTQDTMWLKLHADPAWNSQTRGFPPDLGVLIGHIIVLQ
ncbi:hypothetical protein ACFLQR_00740 [Verrucomicrobiota bacterium]